MSLAGAALERLLRDFDRRRQQPVEARAFVLHLAQQPRADLVDAHAGEIRVEIIRDLLQLARRIRALRRDDAVLHLAVGEDEDHQQAARVERHEIDVPERELLALGHDDDADEMRHLRQQRRRAARADPASPRRSAARGAACRPPARRAAALRAGCRRTRDSPARSARGPPRYAARRRGPNSSRSDMMLRIVAGLTSRPEAFASVREPTGWPSAM